MKVMVLPLTLSVVPSAIEFVLRAPPALNSFVLVVIAVVAPAPTATVCALAALIPSLARIAPPALSDTERDELVPECNTIAPAPLTTDAVAPPALLLMVSIVDSKLLSD